MTEPPAVSAVAALDEPTRRLLYEHVVRQAVPVGRDEVAAATGVPRPTVAFHLDKLVGERLLEVTFERRTGRSGPGAGRPAKLYRRSSRQVTVSLPDRHYDLAADLLASALEKADETGRSPRSVLAEQAGALGHRLGEAALRTARGAEAVRCVLEEYGFEPRAEGGDVVLGNCPFHRLATAHTELVCGMTLSLLEGVLDGIGARGVRAALAPAPGHCCVRLERHGTG